MNRPGWRALGAALAARRWLLLLLAVAAAPFLPGALQFLRHGVPDVMFTGDGAVLELRTLFAAQGRELLGPYSRFQWSHPGPAFFYLAVPLYQLFHQRGPALSLFVLIANFATATALVVTARRLRGDLFALAVAVLLAVYETIAAPFPLSWEWNPMTPILPLALLVFLCVRLGTGALGVLPAVAFVASAIVQTHLGFTPAALYLVATGTLFCFRELFVVGSPTTIDRRRSALSLGAAILVATLLVATCAVHEIRGEIFAHLTAWISVLGFIAWAAVAAALLPAAVGGRPLNRVALAVALPVLALALAAGGDKPMIRGRDVPTEKLTADAETFLRRARIDRLRLEIAAHDEWPRAAAIIVTLVKHGFGVTVTDDWLFMFGTQLASGAGELPALVIADAPAASRLRLQAGFEPVAIADGTSLFLRGGTRP